MSVGEGLSLHPEGGKGGVRGEEETGEIIRVILGDNRTKQNYPP